MIIALLALIAAILLFGAGVVRGFLANAIGYGCGGAVVLLIALWLGSYLGEYGLFWVVGLVAALFGLAVMVEDYFRKRDLDRLLGGDRSAQRSAFHQDKHFHSNGPSREERKKLRDRHRNR